MMHHAPRHWKTFARTLVLTALFLPTPAQTAPVGTFIPASGRKDMVYDQQRDLLYITSGSLLLRYDMSTKSIASSSFLGGVPLGMDLSPDGRRLAVADNFHSDTEVWVHDFDLKTGAYRKVTFARDFYEGGTYSVAFGNDGRLLTSSTYEGSGWVPMRRWNPATGSKETVTSIRHNSMLTASADRSVIGFEESDISDGRFGRYRVSDGDLLKKQWYQDGTSFFNHDIGVNRDGTQYAVTGIGAADIRDEALRNLNHVNGTYETGGPVGVVYSPVRDVVYFSWTKTGMVRAFDTNTFRQVGEWDFGFSEDWSLFGTAYQQGRLKMSPDGSLLFATVPGGVRYLRVAAPIPEPGTALLLALGLAPLARGLRKRAQRPA